MTMAEDSAVTARVVMMQKDEVDRLRRWVEHYGRLFGPGSLTILDNGSTDHRSTRLLRQIDRTGLAKALWQHDTPRDFIRKGDIARDLAQGHDCDFFIPCDCDEYLAALGPEGIEIDPRAELTRLRPLVRHAIRVPLSLFNVPERPGWYAPNRDFYKSILSRGPVLHVDHGFHAAQGAGPLVISNLVYLHEHHLGYLETRERAKIKLQGHVDYNDEAALRDYIRPNNLGCHLAEQLLMTKQQWMGQYDALPLISLESELRTPDGAVRRWSEAAYLAANPDVAERWELSPLLHYLMTGCREGRPLAPKGRSVRRRLPGEGAAVRRAGSRRS